MNTLRLGFVRAKYELIQYFRVTDSLFFNFLFPIIMLGIFSIAFGGQDDITAGPGAHVSFAAYFLPSMAAAGVIISGLQLLAIDIAQEKGDGTLKRLGGTPLPPASYFIGKISSSLVTGALQLALLVLVSHFAFGVALPTDPGRYLTLLWVFVLGIFACALVGIALSAVPRSGKSASAVVVPIILVLQFISGIYLPFFQLPEWLRNVASVFPLKWLGQGMRHVFLPDGFKYLEIGHEWHLEQVAIALGIWLVVGFVISRLTFRWIRKDA